jgi:hypothetical protein
MTATAPAVNSLGRAISNLAESEGIGINSGSQQGVTRRWASSVNSRMIRFTLK